MTQPLDADPELSGPYEYLRNGIVNGRFRAGQRLRAQELAAALGVSRTPVREALGRLHQDGLVDQDAAGGFSVHVMSASDISDVFGVREVLELEAARLALGRSDPAWVESLAQMLAESEQHLLAGDAPGAILAARKFHLAIARRSGNALLSKLIEGISDRIHMVGVALLDRVPARGEAVLAENQAILDAFRRQDAAALQAAVREHIGTSRNLIF
ncbi:MAG: GntR family transcriptional regulator [Rhodoferax sp.]|nr:GntR family transcriptional regulator [Rhodoferax sp.]MCB2005486.1 GntR family transcriptional regulator [Rhodoferax sp.]MCB2031231.1 GntR family transcriptional regulator [Rhodoferax sp.]MCB2041822.1 GntR family transcriptional regulator [Rhodoferax sp.]